MTETLKSLDDSPELIFGLVAPIGVDLDMISDVLDQSLQSVGYQSHKIRLTSLMTEIPIGKSIQAKAYVESHKERISYANEVRRQFNDDAALAFLAVSAIRAFRATERNKTKERQEVEATVGEAAEEIPLPNRAYIIRQIKRPEEVGLFRSVYGRQFILVSAYAPQDFRKRRIAELERRNRGGLPSEVEASNRANEIVTQDAKEDLDEHGQNVRAAFPLGDVFIDATSRHRCEEMLRRFVNLLFGSNEVTPTHDEYAMYIAKSASLRSSDLSRQVGAAIFRATGEVVTMGCNEVPKAGGGTYWTGEPNDRRDFVEGHDANELHKRAVLIDVLDRLKKGGHLSGKLTALETPDEIADQLLKESTQHAIKESKVMDLIEFGRAIHAEMSAISDAARKGVSIADAILYCTTFPCHICAKHIVAAGMKRVVYLEPYPKSYASELHKDSIDVDPDGKTEKVCFEAFLGVSPYRYRDLFEKGRRKYSGGDAQKWHKNVRRPMIETFIPSYFKAETQIVAQLSSLLGTIDRAPKVKRLSRPKKTKGKKKQS